MRRAQVVSDDRCVCQKFDGRGSQLMFGFDKAKSRVGIFTNSLLWLDQNGSDENLTPKHLWDDDGDSTKPD